MIAWKGKLALALVAGICCTAPLMAQSAWQPGHEGIGFGQAHGKQWVQMISSQQIDVKSSRPAAPSQDVTLRFAIDSGLHINSHAPHSKFLIPTTLALDAPAGVQISKVEYPQGVDYHLAFDPKDALSVYTGDFGLTVRLHARPGHYTLHGQLRYQACDNRACNPPKMLPVTLNVTAK